MDLYDALKSGTSVDELLSLFNKELNAAQERIAEEIAAAEAQEEHEERLDIARFDAADFLTEYLNILFEDDNDIKFDPGEIEELLGEFEKELKKSTTNIMNFLKAFAEPDSPPKSEEPQEEKTKKCIKITDITPADLDYIKSFLDSLRI